jgi:hypothetical protein
MARCGGSPSNPGPQGPLVFAVTPTQGLLTGGTVIHISGANFGPGATVTLGGVAATDVVVESFSSIAAKTAAAPPGVVEVAITVDGRTGKLAGGYTYLPISGEPPVIASVEGRGATPNEPVNFAEPGEEITLTVKADDPDTASDQLAYQWSSDTGTFAETGQTVKWTAPADAATPSTVTLSVTVSDTTGNSATSSTVVAIHNSVKEVGDLARQFLLDFSDSGNPAAYVVRNFSKSPRCEAERDEEFSQIDTNRHDYHIDSSEIRSATMNFQFGGHPCSYQSRAGDACAAVPSAWESTCLAGATGCKPGEKSTTRGVDYVTASYEGTEWKLCASYFKAEGGLRSAFIR